MPARFTPGLGHSPNPGQAGDSNPSGAPSWLGGVYGQVNGLSAGGLLRPAVKSREREGVLY